MTDGSLIVVVDDDKSVCDTVTVLLTAAGYVVQAYTSASACLADDLSAAACLIADIRMPNMSGLQLLQEIELRNLGLPVIFITGFADIQLSVSAMKAGAVDFIEKPFDAAALLEAVARALVVGAQKRGKIAEAKVASDQIALLTKREKEVFTLLVNGQSNKVAAFDLGMSPRTIEVHRAHIMGKLKARNLSDLVRIALAAPQSLTVDAPDRAA